MGTHSRSSLLFGALVIMAAALHAPSCTKVVSWSRPQKEPARLPGIGVPCCVLRAHPGRVIRMAFAPLSNRLVSLSEDGIASSTIVFWHAAAGETLDVFTNRDYVDRDVVFSRNGSLLGIGGSTAFLLDAGNYRLWRAFDVESYEFHKIIDIERAFIAQEAVKNYLVQRRFRYVTAMSISHDNRYVASGHDNSQIKVWGVATGELLNVLWTTRVFGGVLDLSFSPDGRFIAACQDDTKIWVWRFPDYRQRILSGHDRAVYALAFDPVTGLLASGGSSGTIRIWDVEEGSEERVFRGHPPGVLDLQFTEDGRYLVTGGRDRAVRILDAASGEQVAVLDGPEERVNCVAVNSNATLIAAGSDDRTVRIWDISSMRLCDNLALTPVPLYPARLSGGGAFSDAGGDGLLSPGETGTIVVSLSNSGRGAAFNIVALAVPGSTAAGLEIDQAPMLPMLLPSKSARIEIRLRNAGTGTLAPFDCIVRVFESNGFH
ncbi:MAG: WD40 repeat domain-containing protein, partial [Candidatus Krumholzibacteria bacterium]|nr:WD40 repeat domain-containing protein [Candidatus Krumholzibacteria bacterium]